MTLDTPLAALSGVGEARVGKLEKLGLRTVGDLLGHFPQRYEDRQKIYTIAEAPPDVPCCVAAMIAESPQLSRIRNGLELVKARGVDGGGVLHLTFFHQPYLRHTLRPGQPYIFYGQVEGTGRFRSMVNPVFEAEGSSKVTGRIVPVYPLTAGLSNHWMGGLCRRAVQGCAHLLTEILPPEVRLAHGLCQVEYACWKIHLPDSFQSLEAARRRLIFEELFVLTCGLALLKGRREEGQGRVMTGQQKEFETLLPFSPTASQRRAMEDIARDMASGRGMNRLVQGDVGSGKTVVAAFAGWLAAKNGSQCAMMAPTELLAEQHARTLDAILAPAGVRVGLLTGSVKGGARKSTLKALAAGELDVVVGTHALFSAGVVYRDLGLVIADEQHRFGVNQRAALAAKAGQSVPHVLVMSATPIPRTLALIIYGDLDVSIMDELPPGRTPVSTYVVGEDKRQRMYAFVRRLVGEGRQVYIVCPAVEETNENAGDLKAVNTYVEELRETVFPQLRIGFVHGRLKAGEKEAAMTAFSSGAVDVLVSTTVIEVGMDVPNAALMIVENADRFGLSQLHQLRGRVGRGSHQSYCVLMTASRADSARERLRALAATRDGFQIAEEDLRLRGPGDFFGHRQHGLPQLKVADFTTDLELLHQARAAAEALIAADPELRRPVHSALRKRVEAMFADHPGMFH